MSPSTWPLYLANRPLQPNSDLEVRDKYNGEELARVAMADAAMIEQSLAAAHRAARPMQQMAACERQAVLGDLPEVLVSAHQAPQPGVFELLGSPEAGQVGTVAREDLFTPGQHGANIE